jgi:uncharacterized membrane protein
MKKLLLSVAALAVFSLAALPALADTPAKPQAANTMVAPAAGAAAKADVKKDEKKDAAKDAKHAKKGAAKAAEKAPEAK